MTKCRTVRVRHFALEEEDEGLLFGYLVSHNNRCAASKSFLALSVFDLLANFGYCNGHMTVAKTQIKSGADTRRWTIVLFTAMVFLYWIAQYIYMPTLPTYVQSKTDNLTLVGLVLSMYGLWQAIIRLPLGIAADWIGWRKPFIIAGLGLVAIGAWTMGTSDGVGGLIIGRAITGLAAGAWVPIVVAFSALFPPQEAVRASALLTLVNSIGRILATAVTGSLNDLGGYSLAFFVATGFAALSVVMILPIHEPRRPPKPPTLSNIGRVVVRRDVLLPSLLSLVQQYANWAITYGFIAVLAKQFGATSVILSLLMSLTLVMYTLGNLFTSSIVNRIGNRRLVYASFIVLSVGIATAALAPSLPILFASQLAVGFAIGIGYPVLMGLSIQRVVDAERTTAMGLHQAVYAIGMFLGPALSGTIADAIGIQPMFGITASAILMLGLIGARHITDSARP